MTQHNDIAHTHSSDGPTHSALSQVRRYLTRSAPQTEIRSSYSSIASALLVVGLALSGLYACSTPQPAEAPEAATEKEQATEEVEVAKRPEPTPVPDYGPFELKPEPEVPCEKVEVIDVNLGNSTEAFVRNAHCQARGSEPSEELLNTWVDKLREGKLTRRIDVVFQFCLDEGREGDTCKLSYSDPWKAQPDLTDAPVITSKREIGAVCMFFFNCPDDVNCKMDWANTHAPGMLEKAPSLAFGEEESNFYDPKNAGFWRRELMDAKWAGLSFLMPNVYGPDIEDGKLSTLQAALDSIEDPIKVAMFDDSWTWGEPWFSDFWKTKPDLTNTEEAAKTIFEHKWKPFFSQIDKKHWYRFKGKPFIYFYNAGKLNPRNQSAAVIARMKELFKEEFGEEPFVMVDKAYFEDPKMEDVADARFQWVSFQLPGKRSRSELHGNIIDHAMVRWDSTSREHPGKMAKPGYPLIKDERYLTEVLENSKDAELLVLATWNDLGEGTGVNRNYDYSIKGNWVPPHYFMRIIRDAQTAK